MAFWKHQSATTGYISLAARSRTPIHPDGSFRAPDDPTTRQRLERAGHQALPESHTPEPIVRVPDKEKQLARRKALLEARNKKHAARKKQLAERREAAAKRAHARNQRRHGSRAGAEDELRRQMDAKKRAQEEEAKKEEGLDGKPLEDLTRPEAYKLAKSLGIEVKYQDATRDSLIEQIQAHRESSQGASEGSGGTE